MGHPVVPKVEPRRTLQTEEEENRGLLQKKVRFETYLPVGMFPRGWYVLVIQGNHDYHLSFRSLGIDDGALISDALYYQFAGEGRGSGGSVIIGWCTSVRILRNTGSNFAKSHLFVKSYKRTNLPETYLPVGTFRNKLSIVTDPCTDDRRYLLYLR